MFLNSDRRCRSPQPESQSFMAPLLLNPNLIKQELKIGSPYKSSLKVLYTHP